MSESITRIMSTIAEWSNCESEGDEEYIAESLMMTWDGNYFLYCVGGEMTFYSRFPDGVLVKSLSITEAKAWAVSHGKMEAVEKHFADVA